MSVPQKWQHAIHETEIWPIATDYNDGVDSATGKLGILYLSSHTNLTSAS